MRTKSKKIVLVRAPLRVPLGGGGTDLPAFYSKYGGHLVSGAIDKYVYVLLRHNPFVGDMRIFLSGDCAQEVRSISEISNVLLQKALESLPFPFPLQHVELISFSDLPFGTGLGSSSSFVSALLKAFYIYSGKSISRYKLAEQAYIVEAILAGRPIGKHDQYISVFGGVRVLDINKAGRVHVSKLILPKSALSVLNKTILLFYTGIKRNSVTILNEQKEGIEKRREEVVQSMQEIQAIGFQVESAIKTRAYRTFGSLLHKHWETKKRISLKVADSKINRWYTMARTNGALGGKIMGPGGGGFFMFYCPQTRQTHLTKKMEKEGLSRVVYHFDLEGAKVMEVNE